MLMRSKQLFMSLFLVLLFPVLAPAMDLTKVERRIAKEPTYRGQPRYCLLVLGAEAKTKIWLVVDGDTLYVDRDGNGDLTTPDKKVVGTGDKTEAGSVSFTVGDLTEGKLRHKNFTVSLSPLAPYAAQIPEAKQVLARDPDAKRWDLRLEMEMPGRKGVGEQGRVVHLAALQDGKGILQFAARPQEAPILHFGGPLQIALTQPLQLVAGQEAEILLGLGTPGVGPGSTVWMQHDLVVPENLHPRVEITFESRPTRATLQQTYALKQRCCTYLLWDRIAVPGTVGAGTAQLTLSLTWPEGQPASTTWTAPVTLPPPGAPTVPPSGRLVRELVHPQRESSLLGLRFSPDGKQLSAISYPQGYLQIWDTTTGREVQNVRTGHTFPQGQLAEFHLAADGKTILVAHNRSHTS